MFFQDTDVKSDIDPCNVPGNLRFIIPKIISEVKQIVIKPRAPGVFDINHLYPQLHVPAARFDLLDVSSPSAMQEMACQMSTHASAFLALDRNSSAVRGGVVDNVEQILAEFPEMERSRSLYFGIFVTPWAPPEAVRLRETPTVAGQRLQIVGTGYYLGNTPSRVRECIGRPDGSLLHFKILAARNRVALAA